MHACLLYACFALPVCTNCYFGVGICRRQCLSACLLAVCTNCYSGVGICRDCVGTV